MTLREFFDAWKKDRKHLGIYCATQDEVAELSRAFSALGEHWASGHDYTKLQYPAPVTYFNSNTCMEGRCNYPDYTTYLFEKAFEKITFYFCPICKSFDVKTFKKERYCLSCGAYTLDGKSWIKKEKK